jgi:hypothetical protein
VNFHLSAYALSKTAFEFVTLIGPHLLKQIDARSFRDVTDPDRTPIGFTCEFGPRGVKYRVNVTREGTRGTYRVERVLLRRGLRGPRIERFLHENVEPEHLHPSFDQVTKLPEVTQ